MEWEGYVWILRGHKIDCTYIVIDIVTIGGVKTSANVDATVPDQIMKASMYVPNFYAA
jgi:hypothetical protein